MPEKTDEELASLIQSGDKQAFAVLVERFEPRLIRYSRKFLFGYEDAEDVVQEVFLKSFINIQSFDVKRKFSSWLYRIAHNEFINVIRKKGREPLSFFDPDTLFPHPVSRDNPESELDRRQMEQLLDNGLKQLDPKYREPLILYYLQELDYQEISDIMRIPVSTVGVRLKRGREAIKLILKSDRSR
ncbi:MAG: RNA polymerase sigma factor [bacterium]|nr:RNA polymerase sigma factor [bacterium]